MRREPDYFGDQELILIHVARRLKEALAVEQAFDADALDYTVVPTPYTSGILFRSQRVGAFFYTTTENAGRARGVVMKRGFKPYEEPRGGI